MAKWVLFTLLLLNIILYFAQWLGADNKKHSQPYIEADGVQKIKLVGEVGLGPELESGVSSGAGDKLCMLVGPLANNNEALMLKTDFSGEGVSSAIINKVVDKAPGYWVYYGPLESISEARNQLAVFQQARFDSFIIGSGPFRNGISLGVFENIDSARRMKKKMEGAGYEVKIGEKKKSKSEFWLGLNLPYTIENNKKISDIAAAKNVFPEMRQIFCKSIASP